MLSNQVFLQSSISNIKPLCQMVPYYEFLLSLMEKYTAIILGPFPM